MKLHLLHETEENDNIRLYHGTFLASVDSILSYGLTKGDAGRSHFTTTIDEVYIYENPWAVIEVVTSKSAAASPLVTDFNTPDVPEFSDKLSQFLSDLKDAGLTVSDLLASGDRGELYKRLWDLNTQYTQQRGIGKECSLPLPIKYSGPTQIVAVYELTKSTQSEQTTITKIFYNQGGTYSLGSSLGGSFSFPR